MQPKRENNIQATETSLRIIDALQELNGAGATVVADFLDLPNSTVHTHLRTLRHNEYVVKYGDTYDIGLRLFQLGQYARSRHDISTVAPSEVNALAERTGEMANLLIEEHGRGVFIYTVRDTETERVCSRTGSHVGLHATSSGKAILANLPNTCVKAIIDRHGLKQYTPNTIVDRGELFDELETIRSQGYAVDRGERQNGLYCVASPIVTSDEVLGAVSVSGPRHRMERDWSTEKLSSLIGSTTSSIEFNIGGM